MVDLDRPAASVVYHLAAATPIGHTILESAAAARAGISGFRRHPFMIDSAGEFMCVARVPWLALDLDDTARILSLLLPVMDEVVGPIHAAALPRAVPVACIVALPEPRPGLAADFPQKIVAELRGRYAAVLTSVRVIQSGHAGSIVALQDVVSQIANGTTGVWIVAGVDSYLSPYTLEWLEECGQIHGAGPLNNAWGFVPGEAAAAIVLGPRSMSSMLGASPNAAILGVGVGHERNLIKTSSVCIGEGLTNAFRAALAALEPGERVHNIYCDMNGEPYRADEYAFAALRTREFLVAANDFIAPADCWGDIGAAGPLVHIAVGAIAGIKEYANGPLTLVWGSSEGGGRGAVLMRAVG